MEIQELNKENMDTVKELAATNIKISEAKNILFKLQEQETEYLEEREKKALARIDKVLEDSRELLANAKGNYEEIHEFCRTITSFAEFLSEAHTKFGGVLESFKERNDEWNKELDRQNAELAEIRKNITIERSLLANEKKNIEEARKSIEKEMKKMVDERGTLDRAIKRLKEGRI